MNRQHNISNNATASHPTPSTTRGDLARSVVYIDRFPGVVEATAQASKLAQDKLRDIVTRTRHTPRIRDAWELHEILLAEVTGTHARIIEKNNRGQWETLRRRLVAMHVEVYGAA